jgi:hypothetical protein
VDGTCDIVHFQPLLFKVVLEVPRYPFYFDARHVHGGVVHELQLKYKDVSVFNLFFIFLIIF